MKGWEGERDKNKRQHHSIIQVGAFAGAPFCALFLNEHTVCPWAHKTSGSGASPSKAATAHTHNHAYTHTQTGIYTHISKAAAYLAEGRSSSRCCTDTLRPSMARHTAPIASGLPLCTPLLGCCSCCCSDSWDSCSGCCCCC